MCSRKWSAYSSPSACSSSSRRHQRLNKVSDYESPGVTRADRPPSGDHLPEPGQSLPSTNRLAGRCRPNRSTLMAHINTPPPVNSGLPGRPSDSASVKGGDAARHAQSHGLADQSRFQPSSKTACNFVEPWRSVSVIAPSPLTFSAISCGIHRRCPGSFPVKPPPAPKSGEIIRHPSMQHETAQVWSSRGLQCTSQTSGSPVTVPWTCQRPADRSISVMTLFPSTH